jgi:hypothetical protein
MRTAAAACACPDRSGNQSGGPFGPRKIACDGREAAVAGIWEGIQRTSVRSPQLKAEDRGLQAIAIVPPPLQYAGRVEE